MLFALGLGGGRDNDGPPVTVTAYVMWHLTSYDELIESSKLGAIKSW